MDGLPHGRRQVAPAGRRLNVAPTARAGLALTAAALLIGCQTAPPPAPSAASSQAVPAATWSAGWQPYALPGKRSTAYRGLVVDGRWVVHATADRSASMFRRQVDLAADQVGGIEFSWLVPMLPTGASTRLRDTEDAPARIVLAFSGDVSRLSAKNRLMFETAQALSGEAPPYATLMYVWDGSAPVDAVVVNPRTDRIRKIVVESGSGEMARWRSYRRDIRADFRRAFGEDPGRLIGVALMTDSDNTQSRAEAYYGEVALIPPPH